MAKNVIYDTEVNQKLLAGVSKMAKAVGATLGPKGRTVAYNEYGMIHLTKDGVTVAKKLDLKDKYENIGAQLVREASERTAKNAGDGTTGSVILTEAIFKNGLKYVNVGSNPVQIKNGISKTSKRVVDYVKSISKSISTKDEIKQVAKISANGDNEIAEVIAEVFDKLGPDGTIKIEDGKGTSMESKVIEGMVLDRGYVSPYFVTNESMECELDRPLILITDKKLSSAQELFDIFNLVSSQNSPRQLLIIAEGVEGDVLPTLVTNKLRGALHVCAINAPSYGQYKAAILRDLAVLTGGQVVSEETGITFQMAASQPGILGSAKNVIVTKDTTTIIGGNGDKETYDAYVAQLTAQYNNATDDFEKGKLQERISKLTTGIGVIMVGATTEAELKEKKDRVDDAFNSAKNSIKSGIVPGGGIALLQAVKNVDISDLSDDELLGGKILLDSLSAPITKILANAGQSAEYIVSKLVENDTDGIGYEVHSGKFVDMIEAGVVDPTAVVVNEV